MPIETVWVVVTIPTAKYESKLAKKRYGYEDVNGNEKSVISLETILTNALFELKIADPVWVPTKSGNYFHIYFPVEMSNNDYTIFYLKKQGIGQRCNSSLGFIPFGMFLYNEDDEIEKVGGPEDNEGNYIDRMRDIFLQSVTSRLTVAQVLDGVVSGAQPGFDYWVYMVTSCTIACMGIMNTQPIDIAASMCIEPLMGAVICMAFGCAIRNWSVTWTGVKSLFYGQIFCIIYGFGFGGIFLLWRIAWNPPPDGAWPTPEMQSRGEYKTLIYGVVIAMSGGACLSVTLLKNNIMAMTGVAIATTFMPPLVNAGINWALACHLQGAAIGQPYQSYNFSGEIWVLRDAYIPKGDYTPDWSYDIRVECLVLGAISIAYHLINVFFLFLFGYLLLKLKYVIPLQLMSPMEHKFFNEDIQAYQDHLRKYSTDQDMGHRILEEWAEMVGADKKSLMGGTPEARVTQLQTLYDIAKDVENNPNYQGLTRNAVGSKYQQPLKRRLTKAKLDERDIDIIVHDYGGRGGDGGVVLKNNTLHTLDPGAFDNPAFLSGSNYSLNSNRGSLRYSRGSTYSLWPAHREDALADLHSMNLPTFLRNRSHSTVSGYMTKKNNEI